MHNLWLPKWLSENNKTDFDYKTVDCQIKAVGGRQSLKKTGRLPNHKAVVHKSSQIPLIPVIIYVILSC